MYWPEAVVAASRCPRYRYRRDVGMAIAVTSARPAPADDDTPRAIVSRGSRSDVVFRNALRIAGLSSFVITGMILIFLIFRSLWACRADGFSFLTKQSWVFTGNQFGIGGVLPDILTIAAMASRPVGGSAPAAPLAGWRAVWRAAAALVHCQVAGERAGRAADGRAVLGA